MKYYSILMDDPAHTVVYMVRADSMQDALEKFTLSETSAELGSDGRWVVRDLGDNKYDEYFDDLNDLVDKYWKNSTERFETIEIDFDVSKDVQEVFCSKDKQET